MSTRRLSAQELLRTMQAIPERDDVPPGEPEAGAAHVAVTWAVGDRSVKLVHDDRNTFVVRSWGPASMISSPVGPGRWADAIGAVRQAIDWMLGD